MCLGSLCKTRGRARGRLGLPSTILVKTAGEGCTLCTILYDIVDGLVRLLQIMNKNI
jgi:hypothetical protein